MGDQPIMLQLRGGPASPRAAAEDWKDGKVYRFRRLERAATAWGADPW